MTVNPDSRYFRHPWESVVNMGGSGEMFREEGTPDRPWHSPGPPPGVKSHSRRSWPLVIFSALAILIITGTIAFLVFQFSKEDSGVVACRQISEGRTASGGPATADATLTEREYRDGREVFQRSRYEDIRENGTLLMDMAWQTQNANDGAALIFASQMSGAYINLANACADRGYLIPPLSP